MSLALTTSVARLFALEGPELNDLGSRAQAISRSVYARGLPDNWTIYPGRFTGGPRTELLCRDRALGEVQVFEWQGERLKPLCPVLTAGWAKDTEITIARLSPQAVSSVLRFDPVSQDLDILEFAGQAGFRLAKKVPKGHTYRALNGQTLGFSYPIKPGNYINSGVPEFLVYAGLWCRLLVLDHQWGFVERGPDMTGFPLRGIIVAGHFTSTGTTQIFNVNNQPDPKIANTRQMRGIGRPPLYGGDNYYGEANFYRIDPTAGLVPLGPRITELERLWQNTPWKIYPTDPPPGELTTLLFRGGGTGFLRYDSQKGLAQVGAISGSPGVFPATLQTQVVCGNFTGRGTEFLYYEPSTSNPTGNALTDFDMVLASSEGALNRQLSRSWRTWSKTPIEVFYNFDANRKFKVTKTGMEALPGPIRVDLSEPDARLDQIRVTLHMMQGRVMYYNDGELTEYKFDSWQFSFLMNLDKSQVDMNFLSSIDPAGAAAAKQTIAKSGLPDSVFSIECLFLKATDRESLADGNMTMNAPANAPDEAQNIMKRCVTLWRHAHEPGRFLLGTVTRRVTSQAVPTFTVTDVAFQVHPEFRRPGGGSLAWLGMMEGHKMPNLNAARTKLTDPWMRPPGDHPGLLPETVMGIGRGMFMDRYLVARFAKAVGKEATFGLDQGRPQWTFTGTDSGRRTSDDIIRRVFSQNTTWTLRLTIEPHENAIAIGGDIVSQVDMDGYIHLTGWHTEWIHTRGRQKFNGRITLQEDESRGHFAVKPTLWHGLDGGIVVEQDDKVGGASVLTFFESTFTGSNTAERLTNGQRALLNGVMNRLSEVIKGLNFEYAQYSFIPPGGGVFAFRNPKFSRHGDLLLDAVYKDS